MNWKEALLDISECALKESVDLSSYTTFKLKATGDVLEVYSKTALKLILPLLVQYQKPYRLVGWGANQILPDQSELVFIKLAFPFDHQAYLSELRSEYKLPASLGINHLTGHASKFNLKGWEVFTGIPASLGGAIYMNAGTALGEIGPLIKDVTLVCPDGTERVEVMGPASFSYRKNYFVKHGEVIVGATLVHHGVDQEIAPKIKSYLEYRKTTQPLASKNCGCVFKNATTYFQAGRLIDHIGLKGLSSGDLKVSPKHSNFMENTGGAKKEDFVRLVSVINAYSDRYLGIEFELEVKI